MPTSVWKKGTNYKGDTKSQILVFNQFKSFGTRVLHPNPIFLWLIPGIYTKPTEMQWNYILLRTKLWQKTFTFKKLFLGMFIAHFRQYTEIFRIVFKISLYGIVCDRLKTVNSALWIVARLELTLLYIGARASSDLLGREMGWPNVCRMRAECVSFEIVI